jgi:hypothetical protein
MARTFTCDRCGTCQGQRDFGLITIYKDNVQGAQTESYKLELCPQCDTEFREWYRFAWTEKEAV